MPTRYFDTNISAQGSSYGAEFLLEFVMALSTASASTSGCPDISYGGGYFSTWPLNSAAAGRRLRFALQTKYIPPSRIKMPPIAAPTLTPAFAPVLKPFSLPSVLLSVVVAAAAVVETTVVVVDLDD